MFEGHHGPITGIDCHTATGPVDFSHLFVTSSFDWTVKLWSTKVLYRLATRKPAVTVVRPTWHPIPYVVHYF